MAFQSVSNNDSLLQNKFPDRRQVLGVLSLSLTASVLPFVTTHGFKSNEIKIRDFIVKNALDVSVLIKTSNGEGSGVLIYDPISDRNFVLTAKHVIKNECSVKRDEVGNVIAIEAFNNFTFDKPIEIELKRNNEKHLALIKNRPSYCNSIAQIIPDEPYCLSGMPDLALLECNNQINREIMNFRNLSSEPLEVGEKLFTIGHPGSDYFKVSELTVMDTKLKDPNIDLFQEYIKLQGEVNPGNSGGAIFDRQGRIVGIVTKHSTVYSDVGYGISSKFIIDKLAYWGVSVQF